MRMKRMKGWTAGVVALALAAGCAAHRSESVSPTTPMDKPAQGVRTPAVASAATAVVAGKQQADQILIGAALGAAAGAGVGAYMDAQQAKLAHIPGTTVERVEADTLLVRFDSDVLFDSDSARLRRTALGSVQELANVLARYSQTAIVVQGHTDSAGPASHNQQLSERRAETLGGAIVARGVAPQRLVAAGYGDSLPVASNASEWGRRLNRRVTILLKTKAA